MYPTAAAYLMGITEDDFPDEMRGNIFLPTVARAPATTTPNEGGAMDDAGSATDTAKAAELVRLRRYVKNGSHEKRPFKSDILTQAEIAAEVASRHDAPFPVQGGSYR
jgi:hypothetical protein